MNAFHSKLILTIIGVAALSLVLVLFVIAPLINKLQETQDTLYLGLRELATLSGQIESYKTLSEELSKIADDRTRIEQIFPDRESMVNLVLGVERAATTSAIKILNMRITDRIEEASSRGEKAPPPAVEVPLVPGLSKIEEIPYSLELSASYRGLLDFMLVAENLPYITQYSKLNVTADSVADETSKIVRNTGIGTVKLDGVFFVKLEP